MSRLLKASATETKEGTILEVEIPGYSKEDVSVEVQPYKYSILDLYGFAGIGDIIKKRLSIVAKNDSRGVSSLNLDLVEDFIDLDEIEASVSNGILTVIIPFKKKHKARIIPVS
jgi:HSP20 family molecular chaperone IbpA